MVSYKVTARFGINIIEFELSTVYEQDTLRKAFISAREASAERFGLTPPIPPEELKITLEECYIDK